MSIEEQLSAILIAVAPLRSELARVSAELAAVKRSIPPQLAPLKDAAKRMGVSVKTARRRVKSGDWPSRKDGRIILVDLSALRPIGEEEVAQLATRLRAVPGGARGQKD